MAFTFNQGQSEQGAVPPTPQAPVITSVENSQSSIPVPTLGAVPSVPDSPFLYIQQRGGGQEVSPNAYIQLVLTLVAVISVIMSLTMFVYGYYLSWNIDKHKKELASRDAEFKVYPYDEMKRYSLRVKNLDFLMKEYLPVESPLLIMEKVIERNAVLDEFSLKQDNIDGKYLANFTVSTNNYRSLIQQLASFNLKEYGKYAPNPKANGLIQDDTSVKVKILTPIMGMQGLLKNQINLEESLSIANNIQTASSSANGTTTP